MEKQTQPHSLKSHKTKKKKKKKKRRNQSPKKEKGSKTKMKTRRECVSVCLPGEKASVIVSYRIEVRLVPVHEGYSEKSQPKECEGD